MGDKIAIGGSPQTFEPGTLWRKVQDTAAAALSSGALSPISTSVEFREDCGVQFLIRRVSGLTRKPSAPATSKVRSVNPFLPYDPALCVTHASETHVCLLNKFCVFDHHLLLVTREFEHQRSLLTHSDFAALSKCLAEFNSLGFYNAGPTAGASQSHKHLQLVPLPLISNGSNIPLDPLSPPGAREAATWPPFKHAVAPLTWDPTGSSSENGDMLLSTYCQMLARLRLDVPSQPAAAYNLLVTRSWLLIVPRQRECFGTMSLNALAFVGALLVRNEKQLRTLKERGPMSALRYVTGPRNASQTR